MAKAVMLTRDGMAKLDQELEYLRTQARHDIAEKIKTARGFGDLSENSEYDEAKNEQAKIEARISELEAMLKNAELIDDEQIPNGLVAVGSKVRVMDLEYNEEAVYRIVGSAEASARDGRISNEAPVGRALLGHAEGETVTVEAPDGEFRMKILEISR